MDDLIDRSEEEVKKKTSELVHNRELSDLRHILLSAEGRRFIWKLMSASGIFLCSYKGGDRDETAFYEGRRSVGLQVLNDLLEANPKVFSQMQEEYQSDLARRKRKEEEIINKKRAV